jgi:hypothetical protein
VWCVPVAACACTATHRTQRRETSSNGIHTHARHHSEGSSPKASARRSPRVRRGAWRVPSTRVAAAPPCSRRRPVGPRGSTREAAGTWGTCTCTVALYPCDDVGVRTPASAADRGGRRPWRGSGEAHAHVDDLEQLFRSGGGGGVEVSPVNSPGSPVNSGRVR